ncbi:DUF2190 family protein [Photobacterium sp. WH24]|uniref:capsid cement protein n=1 Tax=Photobacterium sp. WH24 TaxID=2827237 RepID=UPI001C43DB09|nr:capsid cement protein [Photobacterium sp. WH24]MBV7264324.1 DUF2190 family protein [Photobacterium sp. WH24]
MRLLANCENLTLTAPAGGVEYGVPLKIGVMLVIPAMKADEGMPFTGEVKGVFTDVPLKDGDVPTYAGEYAYFDPAAAEFTLTKPATPNDKPVGAFIVEHGQNALYLPGIL